MIKDYWTRLDDRQRRLAVFAAAGLIVFLLLALVVFPLCDAKARIRKSIAANTKKFEEMKVLDAEFAASDAQIARIKRAVASRLPEFTLFGHLEKKAAAAGVKGAIRQMNSLPGVRSASFEESLVDLKLDKITIAQLADFLYQIESPEEMVGIRRISVEKMKESPEYLSVQLLVASYTPVPAGTGGP
ncbi:MAG: hypothetical protein PHG54_11765 [Smithellaceae bacterium]|nr:type II secretion system protein M [Syntrophaceae bacterium]MDD4242093.1 hypothetical protein [Smithellaceae bacterium]NLX53353.1 hypothetical protein [Deltaproteobacteria bacterium]